VEPLTNRFNLADVLTGAIVGRTLSYFDVFLILLFPNFIAFIILASLLGITNSFPMPLISAILSVNTNQREQGEI
jgi:MFS family permease